MYILAYETEVRGLDRFPRHIEVPLESTSEEEAREEAKRKWEETEGEAKKLGDLQYYVFNAHLRLVEDLGPIGPQRPTL